MGERDDEARRRIIARRASFVAAALAAIASEQGCKPQPCLSQPQPCLSQPMPCLSVQPQPPDDAGSDSEQQPLESEPRVPGDAHGQFAEPPPGEVASDSFALVVTFISIGQGTDSKAESNLESFVQSFRKSAGTDFRVVRADWGKEGEEDWCFALTELTPAQRAKFIHDVTQLLGGNRLVQIARNARCRQSKNR